MFLLIEPLINSLFLGKTDYFLHFTISMLICFITDKFDFSIFQSIITCFLLGVFKEIIDPPMSLFDIYYNAGGIVCFILINDITKKNKN